MDPFDQVDGGKPGAQPDLEGDISLDKNSLDPDKYKFKLKRRRDNPNEVTQESIDESNPTNNASPDKIVNNEDSNKQGSVCCNLSAYEKYFNVEASDLINRIKKSQFPPSADAFVTIVDQRPDLYCSIWINAFLIFFIVFSASFSKVISRIFTNEGKDDHKGYDFHTLSYTFMIVGFLAFILPTIVTLAAFCISARPMKNVQVVLAN